MIRKIQNIWTLISLAVLLLVVGAILASRHDFSAEANDNDSSSEANYEDLISPSKSTTASSENEELLARLDAYENKLLNIKDSKKEVLEKTSNGESENELLKQQDVLMGQISEYRSRATSLSKELELAKKESESLKLELQTNKSDKADDQSEEETLGVELARYKALVKNLTKDNLSLEAEIVEYKDNIQTADQELSSVPGIKTKISALQTENKLLLEQTKQLLEEQKGNAGLKNELALLNDKILGLQAERAISSANYKEERATLEGLTKSLVKKNSSLESTVASLQEKVERGVEVARSKELLLDKVAKSKTQIAELNSEISKMVQSVNSFEKQNKSIDIELNKAKSFSRQLSTELADLEKRYDSSVKSNQAETKKVLDLSDKLAVAEKSIAGQKSEIEKLAKNLKDSEIATQQVKTQQAQTELVANRVPVLEKEIIELKNKLILNDTESEFLGAGAKDVGSDNRKSYYATSEATKNLKAPQQASVKAPIATEEPSPRRSDVQLLEIMSDKANLRVSAGLNNSVLMELKRGARLVAEKKDGNWYRVVAPNGQRAFISSDVVRLVDSSSPGIDIPVEKKIGANSAGSFDEEIEAFQKLKQMGTN